MTYKPSRLGQIDLDFELPSEFCACRLRIVVMIYATLVNIQTHRQVLTGYRLLLAQPDALKECISITKKNLHKIRKTIKC